MSVQKRHFLYPGSVLVTMEDMLITTLLGSCVSVCLADRVNGIYGISHYTLPVKPPGSKHKYSYGDYALQYMFDRMLTMGSSPGDITAYVYGGSSMFGSGNSGYAVGSKNVAVADEFLSTWKLLVTGRNTGGSLGRKIMLDTASGLVLHSLLSAFIQLK